MYASSSSVYGDSATPPFSEAQRIDRPRSLYAATKAANELMAHTYAHLYGLRATGLRFFTVYGPWGRPDMILPERVFGRPGAHCTWSGVAIGPMSWRTCATSSLRSASPSISPATSVTYA